MLINAVSYAMQEVGIAKFLVRLNKVEGDYWSTPGVRVHVYVHVHVYVRVHIQVHVRVHILATIHCRIIKPCTWMHHGW